MNPPLICAKARPGEEEAAGLSPQQPTEQQPTDMDLGSTLACEGQSMPGMGLMVDDPYVQRPQKGFSLGIV